MSDITSSLTSAEENFVYNVEVLGLPVRRSAEMAGLPLSKIHQPHIIQARAIAKAELRGSTNITKDDIIFGMRDAIDRARILADPMTEIVGWEKIAKLLGYDAPQQVNINVTASLDVLRDQVRGMSDVELVKALGASGVVDVDFYEVKAPASRDA